MPWLRALPLASLLLLQLGLCLWVRHNGPLAISDDDYARVVVAQEWAADPRLDPTGTSWLPWPFFVTGGAMFVFGTALSVAREVQVLLALAACAALYAAARRLGQERWWAALSAGLAASLPTAARLAPATIPEYPTAACIAFSLLCLVDRTEGRKVPIWALLSAGSIYLACASRYEAWPVAGVCAAVLACRAWKAQEPTERRWLAGAAFIAAAFPILWLLHGIFVHGDAFFFVTRVTHYKAALGTTAPSLSTAWLGYPLALVRQELGATLLLGMSVILAARNEPGRTALRALWPLLPALVALLGVLVLGDVRGGAPTHHPERALLGLWLLVPIVSLQLFRAASPTSTGVVPSLVLGAALVTAFFRVPPGAFADRAEEERLGRALAKTTGTVLVLTPDYGYFAVQAASGAPSRFIVTDRNDPREARPGLSVEERVRAALEQTRTPYAVLPLGIVVPGYRMIDHGARLMLLARTRGNVAYAMARTGLPN